jgi:uncharacterized protein
MSSHWHWTGLAIATSAGALLIAGSGELERLVGHDDARPTVEDRVAVLEPAAHARVAAYHAAFRAAHDIDFRVLAIDAGPDLERAAHDYFAAAGVGSKSAGGRGLLLVVDTAGERVRLEVATSLEGVYTDAFVSYVQNRQMVPFFAAGRVADGILATTELIVARAQDAQRDQAFAPRMRPQSMGGGASAAAVIGVANDAREQLEPQTQRVDVGGSDPLAVVATYHERMAKRDARADSALYSGDTLAMLRNWVVTPAQMDNVVRTYRGCSVDGVRVGGDAAVVRYRVDQRQCAPYFLRRENDAWKLDLTLMSSAIRFNHENQWRFGLPIPEDYRFAFADWQFDRTGFPRAE